jgi:hypothetical protein
MLANELAPALKTRCRRTNGKLVAGLDGRSALGRRVRDLADDFAAQLGGWPTLTPLQATAVKRASELSALAEEVRADALRNASIDPLALSRLEGCADRARRALGLPIGKTELVHVPMRERLKVEAEAGNEHRHQFAVLRPT